MPDGCASSGTAFATPRGSHATDEIMAHQAQAVTRWGRRIAVFVVPYAKTTYSRRSRDDACTRSLVLTKKRSLDKKGPLLSRDHEVRKRHGVELCGDDEVVLGQTAHRRSPQLDRDAVVSAHLGLGGVACRRRVSPRPQRGSRRNTHPLPLPASRRVQTTPWRRRRPWPATRGCEAPGQHAHMSTDTRRTHRRRVSCSANFQSSTCARLVRRYADRCEADGAHLLAKQLRVFVQKRLRACLKRHAPAEKARRSAT